MALRTIFRQAGHYLKGTLTKIGNVLEWDSTGNSEAQTENSDFTWKLKTGSTTAWILRDDTKGQNVLEIDTQNDIFKLGPAYSSSGFAALGRNVVVNPASPYTASNGDIVIMDCSAAAKEIQLPAAASSGNFLIDVKRTGVAGFDLTVNPNGAELIEGEATAVLTEEDEAITTTCDTTEWYVIG
jgi:hypothetical protein